MLELVSRGTARNNRAHRRKIEGIVEDRCEELFANFVAHHTAKIVKSRGIWSMAGANPLVAETFTSADLTRAALQRSLETSGGKTFELIARDIGALSYEVKNTVPIEALTDGQLQGVAKLMSMLDDGWSADASYAALRDRRDSRLPFEPDRLYGLIMGQKAAHVVDGEFVDDHGTHHLVQIKASGKLNKSGSRAEKLELIKTYLGYGNHLRHQDRGVAQEHPIAIHLATALDGAIAAVSPAVRQYWATDELLLGDRFWRFVTQLDDGAQLVWRTMSRVAADVGRDAITDVLRAAHPPLLSPGQADDEVEVEDEGIGL